MKKCKSVMLIDDDSLENIVNRKLLERLDFTQRIDVFYNGYEGMNFLRILQQTNNPPEVIFLDINMPVMNGFEFLKEFDSLPEEFRKKIKIIVLTSSVSESDFQTAKSLGCHGYLIKPLTKDKIRSECLKVFAE